MSADPVLFFFERAFLAGDEGRPLRLLSEYLRPLQAFRRERVRSEPKPRAHVD